MNKLLINNEIFVKLYWIDLEINLFIVDLMIYFKCDWELKLLVMCIV